MWLDFPLASIGGGVLQQTFPEFAQFTQDAFAKMTEQWGNRLIQEVLQQALASPLASQPLVLLLAKLLPSLSEVGMALLQWKIEDL